MTGCCSWWPGRSWRWRHSSSSIFDDREPAVRHAAWTYLAATHLGTAFLLVLFVMLGELAGGSDFDRLSRRAQRSSRALLARLPAGAGRVRREGRHRAGACLAARGPPGCAEPCLGTDVGRDDQSRHLWPGADLDDARHAAGMVGLAVARDRRIERRSGRAVCAGAARSEAAARLLQRREYRDHPDRRRCRRAWTRDRHDAARGHRLCRRAAARAQSLDLQGPLVPCRRRGAARRAYARPGATRRALETDEVDRHDVSDRRHRDRRLAAAQRVRQRVPAVLRGFCRGHRAECGDCRRRPVDDHCHGADQRARRRLLRQGVRHRVPRLAAESGSGGGA